MRTGAPSLALTFQRRSVHRCWVQVIGMHRAVSESSWCAYYFSLADVNYDHRNDVTSPPRPGLLELRQRVKVMTSSVG